MDAERWRRVTELFDLALERPAPERPDFLGTACAGDQDLRGEVESLLAAHDRDPEYLEASAGLLLDAALAAGEHPRAEDAFVGRRVGGWVLQQRIGGGANGFVYRAQRADDAASIAAVKLVDGSAHARAAAERLHSSRSRLSGLAHPHLARWLDAGVTADGVAFFGAEYIDGSPIVRHCTEHGLALRERLALLAAACSAAEHLHRHRVVHGALSSGNVLVSNDGVVKVVDLGVASVVAKAPDRAPPAPPDAAEPLPITEYSSPEQVRGGPATPASDVYALGVLLYELLAEKRPFLFATRTRAEIGRLVSQAQVTRPSDAHPSRRHELAGALDAIVLRALQVDPARRHGSAGALADDLQGILVETSAAARPHGLAGLAATTHRFARRHPGRSGAIAAAALVLLGSAAAAWVNSRTSQPRDAATGRAAQDLSTTWSELWRLAELSPAESATDEGALLEAAEGKADGLAVQPERQARMWRLLADVRAARGEVPRARALLEKLLAYQRATLGPDAPELAATLRQLKRLEHASPTTAPH